MTKFRRAKMKTSSVGISFKTEDELNNYMQGKKSKFYVIYNARKPIHRENQPELWADEEIKVGEFKDEEGAKNYIKSLKPNAQKSAKLVKEY